MCGAKGARSFVRRFVRRFSRAVRSCLACRTQFAMRVVRRLLDISLVSCRHGALFAGESRASCAIHIVLCREHVMLICHLEKIGYAKAFQYCVDWQT